LRRRRAGLKRMGLLALALVLALGALGVAHAAWTDSVYIEGTIYTGTLDIDIYGISSTYVYKTPDTNYPDLPPETMVYYYDSTEGDYNPPDLPSGSFLVARAITQDTSVETEDNEIVDIDEAAMTFQGVFPGIDFKTDLYLKNLGSIPVRISKVEITPLAIDDPDYDPTEAQIIQDLLNLWLYGDFPYADHTYGIWLDAQLSTDGGANWTPIPDPADPDLELLGLQLEQDDLLHITMHVLLPEDEAYEHLSLNFSGHINVIQWNMYEES
jgi:hypothetical protein